MAIILELKSYGDFNTFVNSLSMAVASHLLSQEQAAAALKEQMYDVGLLKRPLVATKVELKKKE